MEILSNVGLIFSLLFLISVVLGFLVGLIRGFKKTIIRIIWIVILGVVTMFITTPLCLYLVRSDITFIPGVAEMLNGSTTIEGALSAMVAESIEGINSIDVQHILSILTSLAAMFLSGIIFLVLFLVFKYVSLPIYFILNLFIGRSKGGKKRLLGGVMGIVLGIMIFTFVTTPFIGYLNVAKKIDAIPINGLIATPYSSGDDEQVGLLSSIGADGVIKSIDESPVVKVYSAIGLQSLQLIIFNETSAVTIEGETVKINDEIDSIGNIIVKVIPFTDGTIDLTNFEQLGSDPETLEFVSTSISDLVESLYQSKIFKGTLSAIMPMISTFIEETVAEEIRNSPDITPELVDPMLNIISDFCDNIVTADATKISMAIKSIFDVLGVFPKLSAEEGINALTITDFEKIGNILDSFIESGLVKQENINKFVPAVIDIVLDTVASDEDIPEMVVDLLNDVKGKFENGNIIYKNEFKTVGEIVVGISQLGLTTETEEFDGEKVKELGVILDKALSHNSVIFSRDVIDNLVVNLLDLVLVGETAELEQYAEILELLKQPFADHEITSFATEFDALSEIVDYINELDENTNSYSQLGKNLDNAVAKGSKVIDHDFINSLLKLFIEQITDGAGGTKFKPTLEKIKNNFNGNISYETELSAIETLINSIDDVSNLGKFGEALDTITSSNSKVITKSLINEFIADTFNDFVPQTDINKAGDLADALKNIKSRLTDRNYTIKSYKTEFTAVEKLNEISSKAGKLTLDTINNKMFENNTKTIAEVLDDKIKDSVLIGDCGIYVINAVLNDFIQENNGKKGSRDYSSITSEISKNLDTIKPKIRCGSNKNLNAASYVTYKAVVSAFDEILHYLDDEVTKITDQTNFNETLASHYEESLDKLQSNILLDKNGTRAIASYMCDEIASVLEQKANLVSAIPNASQAIRNYKQIVLNYKAYLNRPSTLANNRLSEKEPYKSTGAQEYVTSTDGFVTNITFTTTEPESNYAYRNNPFSAIARNVAQYLQ